MPPKNQAVAAANLGTVKSRMDFILLITNWLNGHWEAPDWGRRLENQLLLNLLIRELSTGIQDAEVRRQISDVTGRSIAKHASGMIGG